MMDQDDFFSGDRFAAHIGIEMVEVSEGAAKVKMKISEMHRNSHGTVHGGAIFTLADVAFALASNSHGVPASAINASISYMKATRSGTLHAEAREFTKNHRLGQYTVTVTDDGGDNVALFQGMVYRKTPKRETGTEQ